MPEDAVAAGARRAVIPFVAGILLSTVGSAVCLISATGITTAAGQLDRGSLYTGVYLALGMVAGAIALPFSPMLAHRWGTRRAYLLCASVAAVTWVAAGLLVLAGAPAMPVVLALAPVTGAAGGMSAAVSPMVYRAYLSAGDVASAVSRMTVVKGIAWAVGALAGGMLLGSGVEAVGMVVAGLLMVPLVVAVSRADPVAPLPQPARTSHPVRTVRECLRASTTLRRAAVLGIGMALFVAPVMSLVVPIAQALRHAPLYQGAGLLMAGFAVGQLFSPIVVRRLGSGGPIRGAAVAAGVAGLFLVALGAVSASFSFRVELALWVVVAAAIAAFQYASRALTIGASAEALGQDRSATGLAAVEMAYGLAAPVGVLAWSAALGAEGAAITAVAAGGGACLVATLVLRRASSQA